MFKPTPQKLVLFKFIPRRMGVGVLLCLAVTTAFLFAPFTTPKASAVTSGYINFQARLETTGGGIVPDGTYNVEFKLYNSATVTGTPDQGACTYNSGTSDTACQWVETRTSGNKVTVSHGYL